MPTLYNPFRKKGVFMIPAGGLGESVSAAFNYAKSSYHQDEPDPTPTITGTTGGSFNASAGLVFADTGTHNSTTGQIDLSASTIDSHIITYTVDGVQSGQTVGVTASPFVANTYSFNFDGVSSYIDLGTDSSLDIFGGDFSVSLWFNHTMSNGSARAMIEIGGYTNKMAITLGFTSNTGVGFAVGSTWNYNAGSGFNDGNWHHMVATKTGTTYKIYIDNTELSFLSGSYGPYSVGNVIGKGSFGGNFAGKIDEVAIWNTALGETAVQEIYNATNNNTGKALDLSTDYNNYTSSSNLQYWNRLGD